MIDERSVRQLQQDARSIRRRFLRMHFEAKAGHLGSGLSAIDILTYLYRRWLAPEDRFILSKGHAASSLYATLHHFGLLTSDELCTYYKDSTLLPAHPAPRGHPAITAATGSLGHGLGVAAGLAYARKNLVRGPRRVACLLSDGECNEGSVWEGALFAAHHSLSNLWVIVDANGLQGFGRTDDVLSLEPFRTKWAAFGFRTVDVDGHDFYQLNDALSRPPDSRPACVIARTVKGKGVRMMEDELAWHYLPMNEAQYAQALADLEQVDNSATSVP